MTSNSQTNIPPGGVSDESLSKLLAHPISSYFSDAYNTLISVVQGLALGGLFFVLADPTYHTGLIFWLRFIVAFIIINTIWHRYISETQYVAWRMRPRDTLIPMAFAVFQGMEILAIRSRPWLFGLGIAIIQLWAAIAYQNGFRHYKTLIVRDIYGAHFDEMLGPGFGERILAAIIRFQQLSRNWLAAAFIGSLVIVLIAYLLDRHFWISNLVILCYSLPAVTCFLFFDLSRHMNHTPDIQLGRKGVGW